MNANEPVAWMLVDASWNDFCRYSSYPSEGAIPLYTHPVKESKAKDRFSNYESICLQCGTTIYKPAFKTLTDEEIMLVSDEFKGIPVTSVDAWNKVILLFGKAILRKAQEK
jgi:hypothetical protein